MDETYLRVQGHWMYLFRAIDEHGQVLDCYLDERRDWIAAGAFFQWALALTGATPSRVITDKAAIDPEMVQLLCPGAKHRTRRYLNNRLERDHQFLKGRVRPMRGFKSQRAAWTFARGHDLVRNLRAGHSRLAIGDTPLQRLTSGWAALAAAC